VGGGHMSHDNDGWIGGQPEEPYLLNIAGEVYGWVPDLGRWESTRRFDYDAATMLQQIEASNPATMPKPDLPWKDSAGRPLYRPPSATYSYSTPT
jgi:hypothetical protein